MLCKQNTIIKEDEDRELKELMDEFDNKGCVRITDPGERDTTWIKSGHIKITQMRHNYDIEIKDVKVFASVNDIKRLSARFSQGSGSCFYPGLQR